MQRSAASQAELWGLQQVADESRTALAQQASDVLHRVVHEADERHLHAEARYGDSLERRYADRLR